MISKSLFIKNYFKIMNCSSGDVLENNSDNTTEPSLTKNVLSDLSVGNQKELLVYLNLGHFCCFDIACHNPCVVLPLAK